MMNGTVRIPLDDFIKMITARANLNSLKRYINAEAYIEREKIAAICGFELKESKKDDTV